MFSFYLIREMKESVRVENAKDMKNLYTFFDCSKACLWRFSLCFSVLSKLKSPAKVSKAQCLPCVAVGKMCDISAQSVLSATSNTMCRSTVQSVSLAQKTRVSAEFKKLL